MKKPIRVQRKRTKGWRMPPNTVYVGRPSKWGNPFYVGDGFTQDNIDAVVTFEAELEWGGEDYFRAMKNALHEIKGKNLACWCPLDQPCHADVLLQLLDDMPRAGESSTALENHYEKEVATV